MNTWFSKSLGDAIYGGDGVLTKLAADVQQMFAQAGDPPDMAVFTRLESEGRLHCELVVYFSPGAYPVADLFGADPCEKPVPAFRTGLPQTDPPSGTRQARSTRPVHNAGGLLIPAG